MNRQNRRLLQVVVFALFIAIPSSALAGPGWKDEISRDYIRLDGGKWILDEYDICSFSLPDRLGGRSSDNFQIRTYAEGVVSRDYFALASAQYATLFVLGLAQAVPGLTLAEAIEGLKCRTMDAPIGTVDLELKISMTADGVQFEVGDTRAGTSNRSTSTWAELYPEAD